MVYHGVKDLYVNESDDEVFDFGGMPLPDYGPVCNDLLDFSNDLVTSNNRTVFQLD